MRRLNKLLFYILLNGIILAFLFWLAKEGKKLEYSGLHKSIPNQLNKIPEHTTNAFEGILSNLHHPLAILIIQIIVILIVARLLGAMLRKIGQPMVIGEIIAGIALGPSLLGIIYPSAFNFLFPEQSLGNIQFLSQVGLILFMFVIGMDLDLSVISKKASNAIVISHAGIIVPFALGMTLAYFLYRNYAGDNIPFHSFGLFIGVAMSITAFPVLARIIQERGLSKAPLGTLAITCAAADDITAWCLLAMVIAITKAGTLLTAVFTMGLAVFYILFMLVVLKPFLIKASSIFSTRETLSKSVVAAFFLLLFASAYTTEIIGIHALFGAFMAGVVMPANTQLRKMLTEKIEDISLIVLLPLFFVYTGLRTQIGLLNESHLWITCVIIILVATLGKFAGGAISAKIMGQTSKDSLSLGVLMNTRGLMELVVLNIGYDLGVLSPEIFSMMVIMALVTTFMTGPALNLINRIYRNSPEYIPDFNFIDSSEKILISYGPSPAGVKLLQIASKLSGPFSGKKMITALHFTEGTDTHPLKAEEFKTESTTILKKEAVELGIKIDTVHKVSDNIEGDLFRYLLKKKYKLLLIGAGKSLFSDTLLGNTFSIFNKLSQGKVRSALRKSKNSFPKNYIHERAIRIVENAPCAVGVFIDKGILEIREVILQITDRNDFFLLKYLKPLASEDSCIINLVIWGELFSDLPQLHLEIENIKVDRPNTIRVWDEQIDFSSRQNANELLLLSTFKGMRLMINKKLPYADQLSALIIKPYDGPELEF